MKQIVGECFWLVLVLVCAEAEARAYADPGSGALLWQGLLASIVGAMFFVRRFVSWVKSKMRIGE
jgi:hypothetical protein